MYMLQAVRSVFKCVLCQCLISLRRKDDLSFYLENQVLFFIYSFNIIYLIEQYCKGNYGNYTHFSRFPVISLLPKDFLVRQYGI